MRELENELLHPLSVPTTPVSRLSVDDVIHDVTNTQTDPEYTQRLSRSFGGAARPIKPKRRSKKVLSTVLASPPVKLTPSPAQLTPSPVHQTSPPVPPKPSYLKLTTDGPPFPTPTHRTMAAWSQTAEICGPTPRKRCHPTKRMIFSQWNIIIKIAYLISESYHGTAFSTPSHRSEMKYVYFLLSSVSRVK